MSSSCRTCSAPIFWTVDAKTGNANPLDVEPRADGNVELTGRHGTTRQGTTVPVSRVVLAQEDLFGEAVRYVSHFATCPHAKAWRHPRGEARS